MTKEILQKNIDEMEIYLPVSVIEKNLGMPKTTIQKVLNGYRNLPKKWGKVLERYFKDKIYLDNAILLAKIDESGKKLTLTGNVDCELNSKIDFKPPNKEMPQGLSRTDQMKWIRNNS